MKLAAQPEVLSLLAAQNRLLVLLTVLCLICAIGIAVLIFWPVDDREENPDE